MRLKKAHQTDLRRIAMQRTLGVLIIFAAFVMLGLGFSASESFTSEVSEFFTGEPSNTALYWGAASLVSFMVGGSLLATSNRSEVH
jgi:hypothetical protein